MKLLLAQINVQVGAIEENCQKIIHVIEENPAFDLIIFPELVLTGYTPEDILYRDELFKRVDHAIKRIELKSHHALIIIGHPIFQNGKVYNALSGFQNKALVQQYFKRALPNYGVFDEKRYFSSGNSKLTLTEISNFKIGFCICEDLWEKVAVHEIIAQGANVLVCINASPFDYQKHLQREHLVREYAQAGIKVVYVNLVGGQDDLVFDGSSFVMDETGEVKARACAFKETLLPVVFKDHAIEGSISPTLDKIPAIYHALCLGLKDYVEKNNFPGVIVGLSGGIDSALTLAIAVDTFGSRRVKAVMMPSRFTSDISNQLAQAQIEKLNIASNMLPIDKGFQTILDTLRDELNNDKSSVAVQNIQARIRGILLMALSNESGYMVLTTSNKSETAVGYATLYGDMAGGYGVLKDVFKTEVYELAHYRNNISEVIPLDVIKRKPSAELAPNQLDEDNLPPYDILDKILHHYMLENLNIDAICHLGYDGEIVARVVKLIKHSEYKRHQSAPGVKVSPRAFGRDWRYPLTSKF